MNLGLFGKRMLLWNAAILGTAVAALLANLLGLLFGFASIAPHLLYIPVVLAAYKYPRRGAVIAGGIGAVYLLMVMFIAGTSTAILAEAVVRTLVIVVIGGLVAFLTLRFREQELLYKAVFDHSE